MKKVKKRGWIEVVTGPMFSGKSEELIRRLVRAQIARQKVQVFKHSADDRYSSDELVVHPGVIRHEAIAVPNARTLLESVEPDTDVVAIDEAQFFGDDLPEVCNELADRGIRVIAAGLDMDFRGEPFGQMPLLLAIAEKADKLSAICVKCGAPATRSQRLINGHPASYDDLIIVVGAKEMYEARCRHCYKVKK
jgi:thymidine kinase